MVCGVCVCVCVQDKEEATLQLLPNTHHISSVSVHRPIVMLHVRKLYIKFSMVSSVLALFSVLV